MIFLFYLINFIGLSYFLFKKRTFDFFSQLVYFIPGFFGTTNYMIGRDIIERYDIQPAKIYKHGIKDTIEEIKAKYYYVTYRGLV